MIIIDPDSKQLESDDQSVAAGQSNGDFGPINTHTPSGPSVGTFTLSYQNIPPPPYLKYFSYLRPGPTDAAVEYRQSPAKRFWKAFAVALIIYVAFLSTTRTVIHMATNRIHWGNGSVGVPSPEDGTVLQRIGSLNWTSYRSHPRWAPNFSESAETSFILPVASEELYLISRGSYQYGKVQVRQSAENGDVKVDVRVAYHDERTLARATVCRLHKDGNNNGIGIYTPTPGGHRNPNRDLLYLEVIFTFPAGSSESSPLRVKGFTTHTSNFAHEVGDLWRSMWFDNIELRSSNSPIQVDSITLARGSMTSSNAPIVGHFNTSDSLILHTSNAHIQATASLLSTRELATKLEMRTSNSPITSDVSLITDSGLGGNFNVKSRSSNGAIILRYEDSPLRARLTSEAWTSNLPASVKMHPAFEGTYEVSSSNIGPVIGDTHPTDPSGDGRRRIVNQNRFRNTISGSVYWAGNDGTGRVADSSSTVRTSNARATLNF